MSIVKMFLRMNEYGARRQSRLIEKDIRGRVGTDALLCREYENKTLMSFDAALNTAVSELKNYPGFGVETFVTIERNGTCRLYKEGAAIPPDKLKEAKILSGENVLAGAESIFGSIAGIFGIGGEGGGAGTLNPAEGAHAAEGLQATACTEDFIKSLRLLAYSCRRIKIESHIDGKRYVKTYKHAFEAPSFKEKGETELKGLVITFTPEVNILKDKGFCVGGLNGFFKKAAEDNRGLKINFNDKRNKTLTVFG